MATSWLRWKGHTENVLLFKMSRLFRSAQSRGDGKKWKCCGSNGLLRNPRTVALLLPAKARPHNSKGGEIKERNADFPEESRSFGKVDGINVLRWWLLYLTSNVVTRKIRRRLRIDCRRMPISWLVPFLPMKGGNLNGRVIRTRKYGITTAVCTWNVSDDRYVEF